MATQVQRRRGTTAENAAFTGAEGEFTYDTELKTIRVHDHSQEGGFILSRIGKNPISSGTYALVTVNNTGAVISGSTVLSMANLPTADLAATFVAKNAAITGATKCKVTFDAKGLVTAGADLNVSDIPSGIPQSKIQNLQTDLSGKMPQIKIETPGTPGNQQGNITLIDNAINKIDAAGTIVLTPPTVAQADKGILHQVVVQLNKQNAAYGVSITGSVYYFGGNSVAPDLSGAGVYNIYLEYDANVDKWCWGAIKKVNAS